MLNSPWIRNRFTLTFGTIALIVLVQNIYVALNNDGRVTGTVLDESGQPVASASVVLARRTVTSVETVAQTRTDGQGRYRFDQHGQYAIVLTASSGDLSSERLPVPLWFRDQNVVAPPLVLRP